MGPMLKTGWQLLGCHKKAVVFFYLGNLFVASLLVFPFMEVFEQSLGPGLYSEKLLEGLDYDWWMLFRDRITGFASTFSPLVLGAGPLVRNLEAMLDGRLDELPWEILTIGSAYLLLNSFLLAAALGSLALDSGGTTIREFFRNGGEFFGRFLRLTVLSMAAYWLLHRWVNEPLRGLIDDLTADAVSEATGFWWNLARYGVLLLLFLLLNMVFDYARLKTAVEDRTSIVMAWLSALTFCITYLRPALGLYVLLVGLSLLWVGVYGAVDHLLPQQTWFWILTSFLWQQIYMAGRLTIKLLFYSSQMQFLLEAERLYRPGPEETSPQNHKETTPGEYQASSLTGYPDGSAGRSPGRSTDLRG